MLTIGGTTVPKGAQDGAYHVYPFKAEYKGDLVDGRFYLPSFWKNWRAPTTHRVENAPLPVEVRVYNPRQYKLEVSFPSLKGFKGGEKMSYITAAGPTHGSKVIEKSYEVSGWSPSKFRPTKDEGKFIRRYDAAGASQPASASAWIMCAPQACQ